VVGGAELASSSQLAFNDLVPFVEFGVRISRADPNNPVPMQRITSEFGAKVGQVQQLNDILIQQSVVEVAIGEVPECAVLLLDLPTTSIVAPPPSG